MGTYMVVFVLYLVLCCLWERGWERVVRPVDVVGEVGTSMQSFQVLFMRHPGSFGQTNCIIEFFDVFSEHFCQDSGGLCWPYYAKTGEL